MADTSKIRQGMQVYGSDNQPVGTIERVTGNGIQVNGMQIPVSAVARVDQKGVMLSGASAQYMSRQGQQGTARVQDREGQISVPVVEERLDVQKRSAELGDVQVRKTVVEEQQSIPVELSREEVHVERRDVSDRPLSTADAAAAFESGTIRVPVRGEEAVVTKEAVVTGEVVINKERTVEHQEVTDTVRKQRIEVDENYQKARSNFQQHFNQKGATSGRTFEQAEPNYRAGFEAAHDERYAGKAFEDVEPDLRRSREATAKDSGSSWDHLREEIREGWSRARGR